MAGVKLSRAAQVMGSVKACRVLIADDHAVVRRGVRALLDEHPGWEICGEAATGREVVEKVRASKPDIVIMDIAMPGLNGLEATRQILKERPKTEILVLTVHDSEQLEQEALAAGARGYVLKTDDSQELVTALDQLRRHRPFFTAKITRMVLSAYLDARAQQPKGELSRNLTSREKEILQLIAEGKTGKEAASVLNLSTKTVESHRNNMLRKLNLHSVSDLVRYAIRNKIVEP